MNTTDNPSDETNGRSLLKQIIAQKRRSVSENNPVGKIIQSSTKPAYIPRYKGMQCRVCLVRENTHDDPIYIRSADSAYDLVKDELGSADREIFLSILLATNLQLIGVEPVATGGLDQCAISPANTFKSAILGNASSIVVCHNHPSGSVAPSQSDLELTKILTKCGELLGIHVTDHLIIGADCYFSIKHGVRKEVNPKKKKSAA